MANGNGVTDNRVEELEIAFLDKIFDCETPAAVESAITYARFLAEVGVNPENYPVFLRLLEIENRWVIDALTGRDDPFVMLSSVQPNKRVVKHIFTMLRTWHTGGIYPKNLAVILGVLKVVYTFPEEGYALYPISLSELNALGKHLVKSKGQDDAVNRAILDCLNRLADLRDIGDDEDQSLIGSQASAIANAFFDDRRAMDYVIPKTLLESKKETSPVVPRKEKAPEKAGGAAPKPAARRGKR